MNSPHFIAKKRGDGYVTVREASAGLNASWVLGGGALLGMGLLRGGLSGRLATLLGLGFVYRGLTGRNPLSELAPNTEKLGQRRNVSTRSPQRPLDEVEEASMESFPASDPPASMGR